MRTILGFLINVGGGRWVVIGEPMIVRYRLPGEDQEKRANFLGGSHTSKQFQVPFTDPRTQTRSNL